MAQVMFEQNYSHVSNGDVVVLKGINYCDISYNKMEEYVDELFVVKSKGHTYVILSPLFHGQPRDILFTHVTIRRL